MTTTSAASADRDVDQEDPAPAVKPSERRAGEEAADHRAGDARDAEDGHEVALVLAALTGRMMSPMIARASDIRPPAPMPWKARNAASSYIDMAMPTGQRADQEDRDRRQVHRLAAEDVGELAVQRGRERRCDQVGRGGPGLQGQAVQLVGDGAHGRRHDRLVQRGQEHAEHQPGQDGQDLAVGQFAVRSGCSFRRGGVAHGGLPR